MIERVTTRLLEKIGHQSGCNSDQCCCFGPAEVLKCKLGVTSDELARVAIEAMREPTGAMLSVGNDSTWDPEPGRARTYVGETTLKRAYETMIDAALK